MENATTDFHVEYTHNWDLRVGGPQTASVYFFRLFSTTVFLWTHMFFWSLRSQVPLIADTYKTKKNIDSSITPNRNILVPCWERMNIARCWLQSSLSNDRFRRYPLICILKLRRCPVANNDTHIAFILVCLRSKHEQLTVQGIVTSLALRYKRVTLFIFFGCCLTKHSSSKDSSLCHCLYFFVWVQLDALIVSETPLFVIEKLPELFVFKTSTSGRDVFSRHWRSFPMSVPP